MPALSKLRNSTLTLFVLLFFCHSSWSLVDYTEEESFQPRSSGSSRAKAPATPRPAAKSVTSARSSGPSRYKISSSLNYGSQNVSLEGTEGKLELLEIEAMVQTSYNIFAQARYYQAKSTDESLASLSTGFQSGNPDFILGFNWLQFGGKSDKATIDLYGGLRFGQNNSDFASSRTDRLLGVTTAKRFEEFAIGLGYEIQLTGNGDESEMRIGNISKLSASVGWVASRDIRFLVEGFTYRIGAGDSGDSSFFLAEEIKFSTVNPKLQLMLSPMIDLTLGASFRTRRLKNSSLRDARLWALQGAYGHSLFAGLSVNI